MWTAIVCYSIIFIAGVFLGVLALCIVQSGARTDEIIIMEKMKGSIVSVLMWFEKQSVRPKNFPEEELRDALKY